VRKIKPAANPDAYVHALAGWQRDLTAYLRGAVRSAGLMDEVVKWGHLVYLANGPVSLIRAEQSRVLLGFWRGQLLQDLEPRLKPGGKYEMASIEFQQGSSIGYAQVVELTKHAVSLNAALGDPTSSVVRR